MNLRKQAILYTFGNIIYFIALWLLTVITTQFLGYEAAGALTLAMSIGNVIVNVQLYGVRGFQGSDMSFRYESNEYVWVRVITVFLGLIIGASFCFLADYTSKISYTIFLFILIKSSEAFSDVLFGNIQRIGRLDLAGYSMCIRGIIIVLLFLVGVYSSQELNKALLIVSISAILLTLFVDLPFHSRLIDSYSKVSPKAIYGVLEVCFPLFLTAMIPMCIIAFPRIVLERFCGTVMLGLYGNVSTPALLLITVIPTILTALLPTYGSSFVSKDYHSIIVVWRRSVFISIALTVIFLFATWLLADRILVFVYTEQILPYVHYLYFILISMALYALIMCNNTTLVAIRKSQVILTTSILGLLVCLLSSLPLVRIYGIGGAIAVLAVSFGVQLIVQTIWLLRICNNLQKEVA